MLSHLTNILILAMLLLVRCMEDNITPSSSPHKSKKPKAIKESPFRQTRSEDNLYTKHHIKTIKNYSSSSSDKNTPERANTPADINASAGINTPIDINTPVDINVPVEVNTPIDTNISTPPDRNSVENSPTKKKRILKVSGNKGGKGSPYMRLSRITQITGDVRKILTSALLKERA